MYHSVIDLTKEVNREYWNSESNFFFDIVQIGTGGNGGYLVQRLSKMLYAFSQSIEGFQFQYTLVDGDEIEEKNLSRQPFVDEDIGMPKARILADRYSNAYEIPIFYNDQYMNSAEDIKKCFKQGLVHGVYIPILIGCVDNNATRQLMHELFQNMHNIIYLDSGIDSIFGETPEEIEESGYSGQVVVGVKLNNRLLLEPVGEVYPNILEDKDSRLPTEACGETVVNYPQRMQTNEMAALVMSSYMNNLLGSNKIVSHYTNFNALTMTSRPTYIREEVLNNGRKSDLSVLQ